MTDNSQVWNKINQLESKVDSCIAKVDLMTKTYDKIIIIETIALVFLAGFTKIMEFLT